MLMVGKVMTASENPQPTIAAFVALEVGITYPSTPRLHGTGKAVAFV